MKNRKLQYMTIFFFTGRKSSEPLKQFRWVGNQDFPTFLVSTYKAKDRNYGRVQTNLQSLDLTLGEVLCQVKSPLHNSRRLV